MHDARRNDDVAATDPHCNGERGRRTVASMCGVCAAGCGVNVHLVDGRIDRLTPLKDHPLGIVCPRGMRAREIVYSPDRLLYPQRRVGARGEGRFERITWDEAYDVWVSVLERIVDQHGPESMCIYTGRGNFEFGLNEAFSPEGTVESSANAVLFPFGSPNATGVGSLCYASYGMIAPRACFGGNVRDIHEDIANAELVLVWGANPATDSPPANLRRLKQAKARGARIVVIDHRRTETVRATHAEWIGIRPGTDGALALAAIHVLLEEGLEDRAFVERWTHGMGELAGYLHAFPPERVAEITGVPAPTIRALARSIAAAKGCAMLTYTGLEYSNSGLQAIRGVWSLQALAGHLDVPGGKQFKMDGRPRTRRILTAPPAAAPPPIGRSQFPLYHAVRREAHAAALPRAILESEPYPIRGLIVSGASLITAWPDPDLWRCALSALDLLVYVNRFPTADAAYADLLLPATTMFEIESYMAYEAVCAPMAAPAFPHRPASSRSHRNGCAAMVMTRCRSIRSLRRAKSRARSGKAISAGAQYRRPHPDGLPVAALERAVAPGPATVAAGSHAPVRCRPARHRRRRPGRGHQSARLGALLGRRQRRHRAWDGRRRRSARSHGMAGSRHKPSHRPRKLRPAVGFSGIQGAALRSNQAIPFVSRGRGRREPSAVGTGLLRAPLAA